jgi:hypothetical protein
MITANEIPRIVEDVRSRLKEKGRKWDIDVDLLPREYQLEDDWLYLSVYPLRNSTRLIEYSEMLSEIEKELRAEGVDNVLLVPTLPDDY